MAWTLAGEPEKRRVDNALATKYRDMEPCPGDRTRNESRCVKYHDAILEGTFRTVEWASCTCLETGKTYRVNGKHTSFVMAEMNGTLPKNIWCLESKYLADTLSDVAELYATFDNSRTVRKVSDTNRAFARSCSELNDVTDTTINQCTAGIIYALHPLTRGKFTQEQRARLMIKNIPFVLWFSGIIPDSASCKHFRRSAVVGAMLQSFLKDREASTTFWSEVRDGTNPEATAPSRVLERFLIATRGKANSDEVYAKCIHAWNAFRRNVKTHGCLKWYPQAERPEAV